MRIENARCANALRRFLHEQFNESGFARSGRAGDNYDPFAVFHAVTEGCKGFLARRMSIQKSRIWSEIERQLA
jgi:hypothetical protein